MVWSKLAVGGRQGIAASGIGVGCHWCKVLSILGVDKLAQVHTS